MRHSRRRLERVLRQWRCRVHRVLRLRLRMMGMRAWELLGLLVRRLLHDRLRLGLLRER